MHLLKHHAILDLLHVFELFYCDSCFTRIIYECKPSKFIYYRKVIHMELVMWCKHQNVLVYKSCTTVNVAYIIVQLHIELHKNRSILISNLPCDNLWEGIKLVGVLLPLVFISAGNIGTFSVVLLWQKCRCKTVGRDTFSNWTYVFTFHLFFHQHSLNL